jgi:hypothetical protein
MHGVALEPDQARAMRDHRKMRRVVFLVIVMARLSAPLALEPTAEARQVDELFLDSGVAPRPDASLPVDALSDLVHPPYADQWMPPRLDAIAEVHPTPLAP